MFPTRWATVCSSFFLLPSGSFEAKLCKALNDFNSAWNRTRAEDEYIRITRRDKQSGKSVSQWPLLESRAKKKMSCKGIPGQLRVAQQPKALRKDLPAPRPNQLRVCRQANATTILKSQLQHLTGTSTFLLAKKSYCSMYSHLSFSSMVEELIKRSKA